MRIAVFVLLAIVPLLGQGKAVPIIDGTSSPFLESLRVPFGDGKRCPDISSNPTIADLLGDQVASVSIQWYHPQFWPNFDAEREFLGRLLVAKPSEGGPSGDNRKGAQVLLVNMKASVEIRGRGNRRIEIQGAPGDRIGHAHFEDPAGCEWWGQYGW